MLAAALSRYNSISFFLSHATRRCRGWAAPCTLHFGVHLRHKPGSLSFSNWKSSQSALPLYSWDSHPQILCILNNPKFPTYQSSHHPLENQSLLSINQSINCKSTKEIQFYSHSFIHSFIHPSIRPFYSPGEYRKFDGVETIKFSRISRHNPDPGPRTLQGLSLSQNVRAVSPKLHKHKHSNHNLSDPQRGLTIPLLHILAIDHFLIQHPLLFYWQPEQFTVYPSNSIRKSSSQS